MVGFLIKRFRWFVASYVVRVLFRRRRTERVEAASNELRDKVASAAPRLALKIDDAPVDVFRFAGKSLAAKRTISSSVDSGVRTVNGARTVARRSGAAAESAQRWLNGIRRPLQSIERSRLGRGGLLGQLSATIEDERMQLQDVVDPDQLLDLREPDDDSRWEVPSIPDPIDHGRAVPPDSPAPVNRVQRNYRPAPKPWD